MSETTVSKLSPTNRLKTLSIQADSPEEPGDFLGSGDESSVNRVNVRLGGRDIPNGLAYKEYRIGKDAEQAIIAWRKLKNADIPVPQTFRIVGKPGEYTGILMTDLSRGWKDILLSSNSTKIHVIDNVFKVSPETVKKLAQVDIDETIKNQNLEQLFKVMAEKMASAGIEIAHRDVSTIIFTEDGNLQPIISDMKNVLYDSKKPGELLAEINEQYLRGSIFWLREGQRLAKETLELGRSK